MKLAKSLERLGTESAFTVLAEAKKLEAQGKPMIHLGLGQPDFKTPKHVVEAAKKALDDGHHGYVMSNGIPECRQAVTRWIKNVTVLMLILREYLSCLVENQQCIMQYNVLVSQVQKLYILHQLFQFMSR